MTIKEKTLAEHIDFEMQFARLQLWWMWGWLQAHPDDFEYTLRQRVNVPRRTGLVPDKNDDFGVPAWLRMEHRIRELYSCCADADQFEERAGAVVAPALEKKAREDFGKSVERPGYQCGSLKYDPPTNPHYPGKYFIHISNACAPRSLFDDPAYLPRCLLCIMEKSRAEYGLEALGTNSWLNSYPRWLRLFPPEWQDNFHPLDTDVRWSGNFWGQFISARGTFNAKHGRLLRERGDFPYPPRYAWCTFGALKKHLTASRAALK